MAINNIVELYDEFCDKYSEFIENTIRKERDKKIKEYRNALKGIYNEADLETRLKKKVIRSGKEEFRRFVLMFFDFLKKEHEIDICSNLKEKKLISNPLIRELEIAKYLHSNPERAKICEEFMIEDRILTDYLGDLKNGIEFLDTKIQLDIVDIESKKLECTTTVHPIFLPLNLTEVYALTKYLPSILKEDDLGYDIILSIISKIKSQLSDYSIKKLDLVKDNDSKVKFNPECDEFLNKKKNLILFALKSGETFEFLINDEQICGKLECGRDGSYYILSDENELKINIDVDDIKFLKKI